MHLKTRYVIPFPTLEREYVALFGSFFLKQFSVLKNRENTFGYQFFFCYEKH